MQIITNPGSNVSPELCHRYRIALTSQMRQQLISDGVTHELREPVSHDILDSWVQKSKVYPTIVGTSAADTLQTFLAAAKSSTELLNIVSSRRIVGTYQAAIAASKTLRSRPTFAKHRVEVVDSCMTDVGAGMLTIYAAAQAQRGGSVDVLAPKLRNMATGAFFGCIPESLDNMVRGGHAGFIKAAMAEFLGRRPIVQIVDGTVQSTGTISTNADPATTLAKAARAQLRSAQNVWVGISHGSNSQVAARAAVELAKVFNVRYTYIRLLAPSIYLNLGRGSLLVTVLPVEPGDHAPE
jgi:DegV family protein with EDD domain